MNDNKQTLQTCDYVVKINHVTLNENQKKSITDAVRALNVDVVNGNEVLDIGFLRYKDDKLWSVLKGLINHNIHITISSLDENNAPVEDIVDNNYKIIAMSTGHTAGDKVPASIFVKFELTKEE